MDRLESSTGKFDYETWNPFWDKRVNTYTNEFEYNVTGKILHKTQENKGLLTETNETVTIAETTYDWAYEYSGSHPNAVTSAGTREFNYDLNGNMTQMTDTAKSLTRTLNWDDENRLKKTTDSPRTPGGGNDVSIVTTYEYDASGMRALKKGKYGTVQYVSDNYTVRNKDLVSKHVFAGNTRLVSKVVMNEEKSGKMVATEQGSYYYHADHLGSSSVVTDKAGKFYEHLEYFPYGETWVHNKATSEQQSTPYKFTSKELDEETGLYYFKDRYYDARLSRWISADPPLSRGEYFPVPPVNDKAKEKNENLPGMGGVFNSINLDAYQYAGQNPVKFVDPDGNAYILTHGGKNYYRADTRADNVMKALYSLFIPVVGSDVYDGIDRMQGRTNLKPDGAVKKIGTWSLESSGLLKNSKKLSEPIIKFGKKASAIATANNVADLGIAGFTGTDKAEYAIQELGLLDGYDKGFIQEMAPLLESEMGTLLKNGAVQINSEGNVMGNKAVIDEVSNGIKSIYENQWKKGK